MIKRGYECGVECSWVVCDGFEAVHYSRVTVMKPHKVRPEIENVSPRTLILVDK